jgi:hypothetical protein
MTRFLPFLTLALTALALTGCGCDTTSLPYVWPEPVYGEPSPGAFFVRYSELYNSEEEVRATIAETCGAHHDAARVFASDYRGSVLHPQQVRVECGPVAEPKPGFRGHDVDRGRLVSLKPAPAPLQRSCRR